MNNLEFAKELQKTFITLGQDVSLTLVFLKYQIGVYSDG